MVCLGAPPRNTLGMLFAEYIVLEDAGALRSVIVERPDPLRPTTELCGFPSGEVSV